MGVLSKRVGLSKYVFRTNASVDLQNKLGDGLDNEVLDVKTRFK